MQSTGEEFTHPVRRLAAGETGADNRQQLPAGGGVFPEAEVGAGFEEYRLPGGAAIIINIATYGEKRDYDRYPGNTLSMVVVNTLAWFVYAAAALFPDAIWLGLATMFFGFVQFLGHGVQMNIKTKGWYNPGLATAVLLHLPIGVYYIAYITQHQLATGWDYLWGALGLVGIMALTVIAPVQGLKNRNTPYALTEEEMNHFHMRDKLNARGVI